MVFELLGETLLRGNSVVKTCDALASKDRVCIYFSAHWCPPCRRFTPTLAAKYSQSNMETEVVFCSSDQDQNAFKGYFAEMPWLAVPYSERELKNKLSAQFGVRGIPTLVVLDGKTGKLITTEGRGQIDTLFKPASPRGVADQVSPPAPPATASPFGKLLGPELVKGKARVKTDSTLINKSRVCIYFSAHWCPPCRRFTPMLAAKYSQSNMETEVVFCSSDRDQNAFKGYFAEMPWLAVPYSERELKNKLSAQFGVRGIPTLVVLDGKTGKLITTEGRGQIDTLFKKVVKQVANGEEEETTKKTVCGGCTVC